MPRGPSAGGVEILITTQDLRDLYLRLREVEPKLRVVLRREIIKAGKDAADAVRREASWSSRIPGAVSVKASFAARTTGVKIVVDAKKAPEARPLEHGGSPGMFRHPVYANPEQTRDKWTWVSQQARPFFHAAIEGMDARFEERLYAIATEVALAAGFK